MQLLSQIANPVLRSKESLIELRQLASHRLDNELGVEEKKAALLAMEDAKADLYALNRDTALESGRGASAKYYNSMATHLSSDGRKNTVKTADWDKESDEAYRNNVAGLYYHEATKYADVKPEGVPGIGEIWANLQSKYGI
jgi:hypothetical protein